MAARKRYPEDDIERLDADAEGIKPWHCQPREPAKAFSLFKAYLQLGGGRSIIRLMFHLGCSENHLRKLSARWDWVERARRYDSRLAEVELEAKEEVHARKSAEWAARKMEAAEKDWERAQLAGAKAEELLKGDTPAKWNLKEVVDLLGAASDLQRSAIEQALGDDANDDGFDPMTADPKEAREFLAREGIPLPGRKPKAGD